MNEPLHEPGEVAEVRLMNEIAAAERRLGESATGALAAVRLLENAAVVLVLHQAASDFAEHARTGRVPARGDVRYLLTMVICGRLGAVLAPYMDEPDPEAAEAAEAALVALGAELQG